MDVASWDGRRAGACHLVAALGLLWTSALAGAQPADVDLREAVVVTSPQLPGPERAAVTLLLEEVEKRTLVRWPTADRWPAEARPVVAVGTAATAAQWAGRFSSSLGAAAPLPAEGFRIRVITREQGAPAVLVAGNDSRGVLFGIGGSSRSCGCPAGASAFPPDSR